MFPFHLNSSPRLKAAVAARILVQQKRGGGDSAAPFIQNKKAAGFGCPRLYDVMVYDRLIGINVR
jgi:hypothetical protein